MKVTKRFLPLLIVSLFVICSLTTAQAADVSQPGSGGPVAVIDGFLGNPWGASLDQVKKNLLARPGTSGGEFVSDIFPPWAAGMDKPIPGYAALAVSTPINGRQHFVVLSFYNDKLYRVYAEREVSETIMFREFETASDMLRQNYGEPRDKFGINTNHVRRWAGNSSLPGKENSIRLSIAVVSPGIKHVNSNTGYVKVASTTYYLAFEYEEGAMAAIVATRTGQKSARNEY